MAFAYPTSTDLQALLDGAGVSYGSTDLTGAIQSATEEFERRTGWIPFGTDVVDRTLWFDPPAWGSFGCVLSLRYGLQSLTSLTVGIATDGSGGTVLTQGVDFRLAPYDGGQDKKPYTKIEFINLPYGTPKSIKVIGKFGYTSTLKADVKNAILGYAASQVMQDLVGSTGSVKREKQGPVEIEYDVSAGQNTIDRYSKAFDKICRQLTAPWRML